MTPYYEDDACTIYHGDCFDVLEGRDWFDVDATIADPPYGETSLEWDRWPAGWPTLLASVTAPHVPLWCFGSVRLFMEQAHEFAGWSLAQDIVWRKHNGSNFHADRFRRVHELAAMFYRGPWADVWRSPVTTPDAVPKQVRRKERPTHTGDIGTSSYRSEDGGPRLQRSVIDVRSCHGYAVHPTQKPIGILTPLIDYSVPVGGMVLDPFMGSGSTLVAAVASGRRAIGIEGREDYCEAAATRLAQGSLFAPVALSGDPK